MQAVGQLAGGVAHDFNNLLTAMIGFTDLLLTRHGQDDPDFSDLMQIKQNANRATDLVRQLLAFSRKQKLRPEIMDPVEALNDLQNLLSRLIGGHIKLSIEHGPDIGNIRADGGNSIKSSSIWWSTPGTPCPAAARSPLGRRRKNWMNR